MVVVSSREAAFDPQDLERLLVARQNAGDIEGMLALFAPDAVLEADDGRVIRGLQEMRRFYVELVASGRKFVLREQRPALICGDLAMTSTRLPDGDATTEVARRQSDGSWLWVIDRYSVR